MPKRHEGCSRCVSGGCATTAHALASATYGYEHSTRARSVSRRKSLSKSIYRASFFSLLRRARTYAHLPSSFSLSLSHSLPPCSSLSLHLLLSLSDGTHRSGTMIALYSAAALVEFGLAPAKRYSRRSRHVELIVAERCINRFSAIVRRGGGLARPSEESRAKAPRRRARCVAVTRTTMVYAAATGFLSDTRLRHGVPRGGITSQIFFNEITSAVRAIIRGRHV